ncbi:MAG: nucleotidyltransferase domain-containing protein [Candidatus Brocadiae bacterium]|nr:nucleotidyltransferase domain-containing protein [Candidatus Brocadiia bacterium]
MAAQLDEVIAMAEEAVRILKRHADVLAAYVFGSHVDGAPHEDSDLDLAVFAEGVEELDLVQLARLDRRVHQEVGNAVEVHYFPASAATHSEPASFATYVKKHGVKLAV